MITIHTMAFNEAVFLQFMIDHYRSRFPNCHIVVYDNESTDDTAKIALQNNCEVRPHITNGIVDDAKLRDLKNNCWKNASTDWVLVCDVDELLDINMQQLQEETATDVTIIQSEAYNMVNMEDNFDFINIKYGARCPPYDKSYLFNKKYIREINYEAGGHKVNPNGIVKYSNKQYKLYHYNCINIEYNVARHVLTAQRLGEVNRKNGWGSQYLVPLEQKRSAMLHSRTYVTKIID